MENYVVMDGNVLGYVIQYPSGFKDIQVLRASVLLGANIELYNPLNGPTPYPMDESRIRKATAKDFETFRVCLPPEYK